jgi:hypothetical protein
MTTPRQRSNSSPPPAAEAAFAASVGREFGTGEAGATEPSLMLRRALAMLDAVGHLLQALSPAEIQAAAERVYLGRLSKDHAAIYWKIYGGRHRVLTEVFATQHAALARLAAAHVDHGSGCDEPEDVDEV